MSSKVVTLAAVPKYPNTPAVNRGVYRIKSESRTAELKCKDGSVWYNPDLLFAKCIRLQRSITNSEYDVNAICDLMIWVHENTYRANSCHKHLPIIAYKIGAYGLFDVLWPTVQRWSTGECGEDAQDESYRVIRFMNHNSNSDIKITTESAIANKQLKFGIHDMNICVLAVDAVKKLMKGPLRDIPELQRYREYMEADNKKYSTKECKELHQNTTIELLPPDVRADLVRDIPPTKSNDSNSISENRPYHSGKFVGVFMPISKKYVYKKVATTEAAQILCDQLNNNRKRPNTNVVESPAKKQCK